MGGGPRRANRANKLDDVVDHNVRTGMQLLFLDMRLLLYAYPVRCLIFDRVMSWLTVAPLPNEL